MSRVLLGDIAFVCDDCGMTQLGGSHGHINKSLIAKLIHEQKGVVLTVCKGSLSCHVGQTLHQQEPRKADDEPATGLQNPQHLLEHLLISLLVVVEPCQENHVKAVVPPWDVMLLNPEDFSPVQWIGPWFLRVPLMVHAAGAH